MCIYFIYLLLYSLHPYLFFDKNRKSVTHVGLALKGLQVVDSRSKSGQFSVAITPEVCKFLSKKVNVPDCLQRLVTIYLLYASYYISLVIY